MSSQFVDIFSLAFPDNSNLPACLLQLKELIFIPLHIPPKLFDPELNPGLWCVSVLAIPMSVPETAMYEDNDFILRKNNIWFTW
jgi:hypothetical protein